MKILINHLFSFGLALTVVTGITGAVNGSNGLGSAKILSASSKTMNPLPQQVDIVGDWKLAFETYDENENKKLDPEERKKGFSNHFFFRFNSDGSALVNFNNTAQAAFKGHYKISVRKNLQFLSVYVDDDKNENPDGLGSGWYIIAADKNELVLLGGLVEKAFWIFKRS